MPREDSPSTLRLLDVDEDTGDALPMSASPGIEPAVAEPTGDTPEVVAVSGRRRG